MLVRRGGPQAVWRGLAFGLGLVLLTLIVAVATLFSSGAPFLSIWLVLLVFGAIGAGVLVLAPQASAGIERFGFGLLVFFVFATVLWPRYAGFRLPGMPSFSLSRLSLLALLIVGMYLLAKGPAFRQRLQERAAQFRVVIYPVLLLILWKLVASVASEYPVIAVRAWLNDVLSTFAPLFIALGVVQTRNDVHKLVAAFVASALLVGLLGLLEWRLGHNLFAGILQVDSEYLEQVLREKLRGDGARLQSTFSHPLTLSEFMVLVTPVTVYWAFSQGFRWLRALALLALLCLFAVIVAKTGSRSGIGTYVLVLGLLAPAMLLRRYKLARHSVAAALNLLVAIAIVCIGLVAVYFVLDIVVGRTAAEQSSSLVRLRMWEAGLAKAAVSPLLGYGQDIGGQVLGFVGNYGVLTLDSSYLSYLLDGGFPSLILFAFVLLALVGLGLRHGLAQAEPDLLALALAASVFGFALIKGVLSLPHNHGLVMVLVSCMLVSIADRLRTLQVVQPAAHPRRFGLRHP
ncbi:O-antigen ligase family protein [Pseudaquabacterium pictum]|uniref:O-antigen ligase-related domain-containing protein n=1 Tax=Pseudaquabacterium pictum TaxID=2315236 RepID=A0A480AXZ0_9BURK|nr:O-antigen ligase family protein [Rubrivivax pictus]GCL65112.1 hypothetical protein AQPW35_41930 [Rubrivivax pictus]